jgi:hypothetical protein
MLSARRSASRSRSPSTRSKRGCSSPRVATMASPTCLCAPSRSMVLELCTGECSPLCLCVVARVVCCSGVGVGAEDSRCTLFRLHVWWDSPHARHATHCTQHTVWLFQTQGKQRAAHASKLGAQCLSHVCVHVHMHCHWLLQRAAASCDASLRLHGCARVLVRGHPRLALTCFGPRRRG